MGKSYKSSRESEDELEPANTSVFVFHPHKNHDDFLRVMAAALHAPSKLCEYLGWPASPDSYKEGDSVKCRSRLVKLTHTLSSSLTKSNNSIFSPLTTAFLNTAINFQQI